MKTTICALSFPIGDRFTKSIFMIDESDSQKRLKQVNHDRFDMQECSTTMVGRSLIMVKHGTPNTITRYDNLTVPRMLRESKFEPMTNEKAVLFFSLTHLKDSYMLFSGGYEMPTYCPLANTHLLNIISGKWLNPQNMPNLNDSRSHHSSCTLQNQAYVFYGLNLMEFKHIESIERS